MAITLRQVEELISNIRECDNMIRYFQEYETYSDTMLFCRGTRQGTRDAMVDGLLRRRTNMAERLQAIGIDV